MALGPHLAATLRFMHLKHMMNPRHEFAIVCLTDAAIWVPSYPTALLVLPLPWSSAQSSSHTHAQFQDFTSDVELLAKKVSTLQTQGDFPRFNMSSVFDLLYVGLFEAVSLTCSFFFKNAHDTRCLVGVT